MTTLKKLLLSASAFLMLSSAPTCFAKPIITFQDLQFIRPGVTTRAELLQKYDLSELKNACDRSVGDKRAALLLGLDCDVLVGLVRYKTYKDEPLMLGGTISFFADGRVAEIDAQLYRGIANSARTGQLTANDIVDIYWAEIADMKSFGLNPKQASKGNLAQLSLFALRRDVFSPISDTAAAVTR
jgi:hypothetical protein